MLMILLWCSVFVIKVVLMFVMKLIVLIMGEWWLGLVMKGVVNVVWLV